MFRTHSNALEYKEILIQQNPIKNFLCIPKLWGSVVKHKQLLVRCHYMNPYAINDLILDVDVIVFVLALWMLSLGSHNVNYTVHVYMML